jgi:hypothetical protein
MNEATGTPTFETMRGRSWIDLTLCNNVLVQKTSGWTCGEEESCADHKILFFNITAVRTGGTALYYPGKRYLTKTEDWGNFVSNLMTNILSNFGCLTSSTDLTQFDEELCNKVKLGADIGESIHKFITAVALASDSTFRVSRPGKRAMKERSVPWWNGDITLLHKKTLALGRRYQRMTNDGNLRQQRRLQY